ncbi:hypothetical protein BH23CHL2_BH23CHL2_27780 [soil metagenome]
MKKLGHLRSTPRRLASRDRAPIIPVPRLKVSPAFRVDDDDAGPICPCSRSRFGSDRFVHGDYPDNILLFTAVSGVPLEA